MCRCVVIVEKEAVFSRLVCSTGQDCRNACVSSAGSVSRCIWLACDYLARSVLIRHCTCLLLLHAPQ